MEQNGRKAVRYLYFAGNLVVRVVGSAIFLLLAWYSFWYTQYMLPGGRELPVDVRDSGSRNLMGLAVAAGIMAGLWTAGVRPSCAGGRWRRPFCGSPGRGYGG